nr:hypothetical protein [Tanacetum cinerariifolium]
MLAPDKEVRISKESPITRTERIQETYKNVSQDIRDQLNAKAEVVQIILTGIDNDIYSIVDACPNAYEMWKAIERFYKMMNELIKNQCKVTNHQVNVQFLLQLQPEWQRFVTLVKQSQELKTVSYHKLYDILKQHQHEVNEIRAERIARVANPLALVAQQQPVYHPQTHPTQYTQNSSTRSQQAATRNRGKAIVNSPQPIYDQESSIVAEDDETSKDKEIDKLMALISLVINKIAGYENQRIGNVAGARETVEQADWRDDTDDDELEDQELEVHYMYMEKLQEVSPDAADSGPIFDAEPLQKVSNDDHYNVFAIKSAHPEQSESVLDIYPIEQDVHNVIIDSLDMSYDRIEIDQNDDDHDLAKERELLASLIKKLKGEIDESKNHNKFLKEAQIKLYKTREDKELGKVIALENKVKVLDNIVYKTGQSVQTMNMLNNKCQTSFAKPEFLKKAQRANLRLYDIDEVTNMQCDYLELLEKCECLETELSKSKLMSKSFKALQKHAINLKIDLQQCQEKIKNNKSFTENLSKEFCKEREQYFEIQDLKAQLRDKDIVISELKKLIEKLKGISVDTKFEKSSVIRQLNAFKSQRPSVLGKPTTFLNSFERRDFLKSKSVTRNNVLNDFSKPVTAQTLPLNKKSILKNMNVLAP